MFLLRRLDAGLKEGRLITERLTMAKEKRGSMNWSRLEKLLKETPEKNLLPKFEEFCMQECQVKSKGLTLQDKSKFFERTFQKVNLLQMLGQDSTITEKDFGNWWPGFAEEKSTKLWLPTKTDLPDLTSISFLKSVKKMEFPSWFTGRKTEALNLKEKKLNCKKICSALSTSSLQGETEKEQVSSKEKDKEIEKKKREKKNKSKNLPEPNGCTTIRLYPNSKQKEKLDRMLSANRWAYNLLVEKTKGRLYEKTFRVGEEKKKLRPLIQKRTLANATYSDVREEAFDSAFSDLWAGRKSAIENYKTKWKRYHERKEKFPNKVHKIPAPPKNKEFRKRKERGGRIEIRVRDLHFNETTKQLSFFPTYFGKDNCTFLLKENIPPLLYSATFFSGKKGGYYLAIPTYREPKKRTDQTLCSLDPGARTFLTGYDPRGSTFDIGTELTKLQKKRKYSEQLASKIREFRSRKRNERYNLKQRRLNLETKITNMIKDCHHKVGKWLTENYANILLGKINTANIINKEGRNINGKASENLKLWSHFKFRQRLENKAMKAGAKFFACCEAWTSKTCTSCGRLNHNLGSAKVFSCLHCGLVIDRDVNGARNILLKNFLLL